jgi:opine dehydrogenase
MPLAAEDNMLTTAQPASLFNTAASAASISVLGFDTSLCIIGDGAVALAAGYLLAGGTNNLKIFVCEADPALKAKARSLPDTVELVDRGAKAGLRTTATFQNVSFDACDAVKGSSAIIVAAPTTEYGAIIKSLKAEFSSGQSILLLNAPLGGGLQFAHQLKRAKVDCQLNVLELGALFDCARVDAGCLRIVGARDKVSVCGNSRNETRRALATTTSLSQSLVPASNLIERGFAELERVIRPLLLLFGFLGGRERDLSDLSSVVNPSLTALIRALEREVKELGHAYHVPTRSFLETLTDLSAVSFDDADCLDQALITVGPSLLAQSHCEAKAGSAFLALEVLQRDVCETLVLVDDLARVARVHTPILDSVIELANVVTKTDLRKAGRNLGDLGLFGLDSKEIIELVNA